MMCRLPRVILLASLTLALAACGSLLGPKESPTIYAPIPAPKADASWPKVSWNLATTRPDAPRILDSARMAVRPVPGELQVYKGAMWASAPPDLLEATVLRLLEDSGKLPAASRQGSGMDAGYRLLMDIRHFEADYAGGALPAAVIEVNAKLIHVVDHAVAGNRTFRHAQPAGGTDPRTVADAFSLALAEVSRDIAGWTLASGQAHEGAPHR